MPTFGPSVLDTNQLKCKQFTANLAQAAGTYDLAVANATGGVVIHDVQIYVATVGATLTSVAIQTNDTTPVIMLTAIEGAVANLTVGKNVAKVFTGPTYLHTSKKIQYTIVGVTGTGSLLVTVRYQSSVAGADIA
jgi:hypothetical protein